MTVGSNPGSPVAPGNPEAEAPSGSAAPSDGQPIDHLSTHGSAVAFGLICAAIAFTAVSFLTGVSADLPGIALDWTFGLHVIRAAEIFAIFAVVVMVIVRGWGGLWPSRVSTSGVEFRDLAEGSSDISHGVGMVLQVLPELVRLEVERSTTNGG